MIRTKTFFHANNNEYNNSGDLVSWFDIVGRFGLVDSQKLNV